MRNTAINLALIAAVLLAPCVEAQEKVRKQDLAPRFQEFLTLTQYIILDQEEDVFMQLSTDRDREAFIRTF